MRLFTARRLIVLSLVVVLGSLAVSFRAEQRWDEARALGAQLEVAYDAIDHRRPVLVGEPVEGSAHAYYDRALVLLGDDAANRPQADEDFEGLARLCADEPEELAALRAELVETYGEALELLAEGARRTDGGAPFEWAAGFELGVPRLSSAGHLVTLAVADAELRLAAGESEAAVDRILQGAQFTGDLMRAPTWISMAVGQSLLAGSGRHVLLDPGLLERLPDDALARLEMSLPAEAKPEPPKPKPCWTALNSLAHWQTFAIAGL